eukprot:COSAG01_NODE_62906_length_282_cov_0.885246_2_plen_26_part_01
MGFQGGTAACAYVDATIVSSLYPASN